MSPAKAQLAPEVQPLRQALVTGTVRPDPESATIA